MKYLSTAFLLVLLPACASSGVISLDAGTDGSQSSGSGGSATGTGGAVVNTGGTTGTGGAVVHTGGTTGTGGAVVHTGGTTGTGGAVVHTGGTTGTGGAGGHVGGATGTGGAVVHTGGAGGTGRGGAGGTGRGGAGGIGTGGATGGSAGDGGPGKVLFLGDFETGDLSQWPYVERCATNRIVVYSTSNAPSGAPAPRAGKYAVQFHVLDTDVAPCTSTDNPRAELESPDLFSSGDDRWEAWSLYIPTNHPAPACTNCPNGTFFAFQEDYGAPFDGPASLAWYFDFPTNQFSMDRGQQYSDDQPWLSPLITGQWVDFLVHKKFSNTNDGTGFVEAWENGNPITFSSCNCTRLSTQTMHSTQTSLAFYMTAYRALGLFTSFDTYYDEVRVGTTRASVQIP